MKLGGIYISVRAKTTQLDRDLKKAKTKVERTAIRMEKALNNISFAKVGVAAAAFTAAYVYGMKKAIDAASDLQEVQGKFDVVFKAHKEQAEDMAKVLVDSYAMSTRESKQYLSSIQDLLVPMGMAADKAVLMSNEVVKLAADLGSFNNLPTATVMLDIQSALVGNFETMKKYGVILNETVIKQEALNMGLWDGKGMVDANTKAQVAYKLMVKGSAAAIGDLERTQDSYANQTKKLAAQFEDLKATVGNELLPVVTEWVKQVNLMIAQNPELIRQIGEISSKLLEMVGAFARGVGEIVGTLAAIGSEDIGFWEKMFWGPGGKAGFDAKQASMAGRLLTDVEKLKAAQKRAGIDVISEIGKATTKTKESIVELGMAMKEITEADAEAMAAVYQRQFDIQKQYYVDSLSAKDEYNQMILAFDMELKNEEIKLLEERALKEKEIQEAAEKNIRKRMQTTVEFLNGMAGLLDQFGSMLLKMSSTGAVQNRKDFNRQKNLNMGQAAMSTAAGITKAYNTPGGYAGIAMGILIGALGAVQIATIEKQKYQYAKGGVFTNKIATASTAFNNSVLGEAGPEAIMPLAKTAGGELGVKTTGGGEPAVVNYNINAIDSQSFLDIVRRNPNAITLVMNEQMQRGNSALNANIRRVSR